MIFSSVTAWHGWITTKGLQVSIRALPHNEACFCFQLELLWGGHTYHRISLWQRFKPLLLWMQALPQSYLVISNRGKYQCFTSQWGFFVFELGLMWGGGTHEIPSWLEFEPIDLCDYKVSSLYTWAILGGVCVIAWAAIVSDWEIEQRKPAHLPFPWGTQSKAGNLRIHTLGNAVTESVGQFLPAPWYWLGYQRREERRHQYKLAHLNNSNKTQTKKHRLKVHITVDT